MVADFNSLTLKQKKVYTAIETYIKSRGIPPTVREIGEMVGEKTPGAVQGILNRLEMKGVIKRQIGMARSIQLVSKDTMYSPQVYIPVIKKVTRRNSDDLLNIYNISSYFPLPADLFRNTDNHFIVLNPDKSRTKVNTDNEDYLMIRIGGPYNTGDTILAIYENLAILREYAERGSDSYFLKSDDSIIDKEIFSKEEILIIGKLVARMVKYQ